MAIMLVDLVQVYLPAQMPSLVPAVNLFASLMPDHVSPDDPAIPNLCVVLHEYSGEGPKDTMGVSATGAPTIEVPHVQIEVRGDPDDYVVARQLIEDVKNALCKIVNVTVNGTYYARVESLQSPFLANRDETRRPYFFCNLKVHRTP